MIDLNTYITEKLKITKDISYIYDYHPKDKDELIDIVDKLLEERGINADLNDVDVSKITDFGRLFYKNTKIKNINISDWNVSNAIYMDEMFSGCYHFNSDISKWDVSNVKTFSNMFSQCLHLADCDFELWKDKIKEDAQTDFMFSGCNELKIPSWYKRK